jgi:hypothetical protein
VEQPVHRPQERRRLEGHRQVAGMAAGPAGLAVLAGRVVLAVRGVREWIFRPCCRGFRPRR